MRLKMKGQVYRFYDAWNGPLYYGSSHAVFSRLHNHTTSKEWYPDVAMILVDWYPSIEIARAVEQALITRDQPPHNFTGVQEPYRNMSIPVGMPPLPLRPLRQDYERSEPEEIQVSPEQRKVLDDLQEMFKDSRMLSTAEIVERLPNFPPSPRLSASRALAALLFPLGVRPTGIRIGDRTLKGYKRWQLEPFWKEA